MGKPDQVDSKLDRNRQTRASRIPDPARRKMLKKLGIMAIAVPSATALVSSKAPAAD